MQRIRRILFSKAKLSELWYIIFRNVFLLANAILFMVVVLLAFFGEARTGLFLAIILALNISAGLFQDIRVWLALQRLQLLTAPRLTRLMIGGAEESIFTEDVQVGDRIALKTGDQAPCDSIIVDAHGLEINEGLITGESDSIPRSVGNLLLAGSVITSGSCIIRTETAFKESRIVRMTESVTKYSVSQSPIQQSVDTAITYSIYILFAGIAFILLRGLLTHASPLHVVNNIGAITAAFVPQGLVFAVTLFFAYGAVHLFRRQVLLQEVSATEKLGRIKNLCMDKTGTLTKNEPEVEAMYCPPGISKDEAEILTAAYLNGSKDSSEVVRAMQRYIHGAYTEEVAEARTFSSWRQYGAVRMVGKRERNVVLVGLPDKLLSHIANSSEQNWLQKLLNTHAHLGKRLVVVCSTTRPMLPDNLSKTRLSLVAVFVFHNDLREGIRHTVDFFQNRGVRVRIISGDNPETTRAIAASAGVKDADSVICGKDIESWRESDFDKNVGAYSVFAGIVPEQKEKIIAAFRKDGFTAMVGDGANDALAIREADLGIAMFDGASATRQLASIVLMTNSFAALPGGVELADMIIGNVEIFSGLFFNQVILSVFFFLIVSMLGYEYPLTPLNINFINYFTIGIPGLLFSYWTLRPVGKVHPAKNTSLFKKVLPFAAWSGAMQACGAVAIFALSPAYLKGAESNVLIMLAFIAFGFMFFACAPWVYREKLTRPQKIQLILCGAIEVMAIGIGFHVPFILSFFTITPVSIPNVVIGEVACVVLAFCYIQYKIAQWFASNQLS